MVNTTALPFQTQVASVSPLSPNPQLGLVGDYITFFSGSAVAAASAVPNEYFTIVTPSTTTWSTYGTLQAAGVFGGNGISGATGAVYLCTSQLTAGAPGTIAPCPIGLTGSILTNTAFLGLTAGQIGLTAGFTSVSLNAPLAQLQAINSALLSLGLIAY